MSRHFFQKTGLVIFGIILSLGIVEACLRAGGALFFFRQKHTGSARGEKVSCRILCIGESTTAGEYPIFLEEFLNQHGSGRTFQVVGRGMPGATTDSIVASLEKNIRMYSPDIVVAMMGLNDKCLQSYASSRVPLAVKSLRIYKLFNFIWSSTAMQASGRKQKPASKVTSDNSVSPAHRSEAEAAVSRGRTCLEQGECNTAQEYFCKALALDPENELAFLFLAEAYDCQGKLEMAEQSIIKAININPNNQWAYAQLAGYYVQEKSDKARLYYEKALAVGNSDWLYTNLAWFYRSKGNLQEAQKLLEEALLRYPDSYWINASLESIYREVDNPKIAEEYEIKLKGMKDFFPPLTVKNYRRLKEILDKKNIKLVCVQYPVWKLRYLTEIFTDQRNIVFVDNEEVFLKALKSAKYQDYFRDMYGGNFGHCTREGEKLLAENVGREILKDLFKQVNR